MSDSYIILRMAKVQSTEGDINNLMDALQDLRQKLQQRSEIRSSLTAADRSVLSAIHRLRSVAALKFVDEDPELDAMITATQHLLNEYDYEAILRKDGE